MVIENVKGVSSVYQGSTPNLEPKVSSSTVEQVDEKSIKKENKIPEQGKMSSKDKEQEGKTKEQNGQIRKAVEDINKSASGTQSEAIFGIHEETNRVTIKIVDKNSRKVIKEFPPEKTLDMIAKVWEMAGIMVDEKR